MAFLRKKKKSGYTCISNDVFNSDLSLKARGLLCTMLSLPDGWEFSEKGLGAILNDGQSSIRSAIKELEKGGFLSRNRVRDENGRMKKCEWIVSDYPRLENLSLVNPSLVNQPQLNTKEYITKRETTKGINMEAKASKPTRHKHGEYNNVLLTDEELSKLQSEYPDWQQRIERLSEYIASSGRRYKSHYATIRTWARKDGKVSKAKPEEKRININDYMNPPMSACQPWEIAPEGTPMEEAVDKGFRYLQDGTRVPRPLEWAMSKEGR